MVHTTGGALKTSRFCLLQAVALRFFEQVVRNIFLWTCHHLDAFKDHASCVYHCNLVSRVSWLMDLGCPPNWYDH